MSNETQSKEVIVQQTEHERTKEGAPVKEQNSQATELRETVHEGVKTVVPKERAGKQPDKKQTPEKPELSSFNEKKEGFTTYMKLNEPFEISAEDIAALSPKISEKVIEPYEQTGGMKRMMAAYVKGYQVATEPGYRADTRSYSTNTSIIEVNGKKYFVIYNYPGSARHRKGDTACRKKMGEKALKATEEEWKDVFVERSLIPVYQSKENDRILILPFIPNIGMLDLLEKFDEDKFSGEYEYGKQYDSLEKQVALVKGVAEGIKDLHDKDHTRGEIIPANLGVTKDNQILFFDPETPYAEGTPMIEQKARDLQSWCISACGALSRMHADIDYKQVIQAIYDGYGDKEVIEYLQQNLTKGISVGKKLAHPIAFEQMKARLTISSRKQYNTIMKAMVDLEGKSDKE